MSADDAYRMLVVDDEQDNLDYLARVFREEYLVSLARNAREALELLQREQFDVIIADHLMPGMTGVELLNRSLQYCPDAVRIVVTGFPDIETAIASVNQARAYRFFTKPLDPSELAESVRRALGEAELERENRRLVDELRTKHELMRDLLAEKDALVEAHVEARTRELSAQVEELTVRQACDAQSGALAPDVFRGRLEEEISRATRHALPLSLLAVSVVGIDEYAARHGEGRRGELLHLVHETLRLDSRRHDVIGRDRPAGFLLLLPMADAAGAAARAARTRRLLEQAPFPSLAETPTVRFEVTAASFPTDGTRADELLRALAQAGEAGAAASGG